MWSYKFNKGTAYIMHINDCYNFVFDNIAYTKYSTPDAIADDAAFGITGCPEWDDWVIHNPSKIPVELSDWTKC